MNDIKADLLLEKAQKVFIHELSNSIDEIERLIKTCIDGLIELDSRQILRFFHSINGTAATLGLNYLSSIGIEWEERLSSIIENKDEIDKNTLEDVYLAVQRIKKKIDYLYEKNDKDKTFGEAYDYVNLSYRGKVLLVDDDITILKLLENAFTLDGYKVYICDESTSAMDMIAITRPDIVILDIMMPRLSGFEILEKIKSSSEYSDMHVIFLSAKDNIDDKIKGIKLGADDYILKPFAIAEVVTRVEMIMRRSEKYKDKLLRDTLTDAYSRYFFNLRVAEELERYKRYGATFSIAFIDMDHYKNINDMYGHQAGDYVLKELIVYLNKNIRKCDSIYRYGGEEFIVLLPSTTKEKAHTLLERLLRGLGRETFSVGGLELSVTFSGGIRQVCEKDENIEQIVNDADKAMYYAKKCGRNRICTYNKDMSFKGIRKTLLIVDDENTILKLLRDKLSNLGYNIITAKDGTSAIKLAKEIHPDAIILDVILPDIDGYKVCKEIKEDVFTHSIKVVMLSKQNQTEHIVKGLHFGADDYLTKPFSMEELEARIMRVLNSSS